MSKESVLLKEVICKFHPKFRDSGIQKVALACPSYFNVELLVEETLAHVGGYKFVDEEGYDFSDYSDSKTTTVNINTRVATVSSVETKIGALRICAYNPFKKSIDFFFVPKSDLARVRMPCYGNSSHKERILFTYSKVNPDDYGWFEDYRVRSFVALATAKG